MVTITMRLWQRILMPRGTMGIVESRTIKTGPLMVEMLDCLCGVRSV
uniref:Uncharacterized protein n=1 Tax=Rhizophora mucronata TaxID=61149 RepID=A0A2P2J432_RHIMU